MLRLSLNYPINGVPTDMIVEIARMEHVRTSLGQDRMIVDDFKVFEADGETPFTDYAGSPLMEIELGLADALLPESVGAAGRADNPAILVKAPIGGAETDVIVKVRRMAVTINRFGDRKVRLDDWDAFTSDGTTMLDLDEIDDPAGDELPGLVENAIERCLTATVPQSQAA